MEKIIGEVLDIVDMKITEKFETFTFRRTKTTVAVHQHFSTLEVLIFRWSDKYARSVAKIYIRIYIYKINNVSLYSLSFSLYTLPRERLNARIVSITHDAEESIYSDNINLEKEQSRQSIMEVAPTLSL